MYNNNQNNFSSNQSETKYFRITAFHPELNTTVIMDSNGRFDKLWQFSAYMIAKGFQIIDAQKEDAIQDNNLKIIIYSKNCIYLTKIIYKVK